MKIKNSISWILQLLAALILLQTLYFKFSAQPESVVLFGKLGVEPWGRIAAGIAELIAGILLLLPKTRTIGAFLGVNIMLGALLAHVFVLGVVSDNDGGLLFGLALLVLILCAIILVLNKVEWRTIVKGFKSNIFKA